MNLPLPANDPTRNEALTPKIWTELIPGEVLCALQPLGSLPPLYLVHGVAGGMVWGYANLARHLGLDQPVFALNAPELSGAPGFDSIEEMAAHYVAAVRARQPHGPYLLGGYCFGGSVAFEMACQLTEAGAAVGPVVLLNASPPNSSYDVVSWRPVRLARFIGNLRHWLGTFSSWEPRRRREFVVWKLRKLARALHLMKPPTEEEFEPDEMVDFRSCPPAEQHALRCHLRAFRKYRHRPFPGWAILLRTRGHPMFCSFHPLCAWHEYALSGVDLRIVPGHHENILTEPCVRTMARQLRLALRMPGRVAPVVLPVFFAALGCDWS